MNESQRRNVNDRRQGDRREREDRRKISLDELFTGDEIDWSKLGLKEDRRKGDRRTGGDPRSVKDRRDRGG